MTSKTEIKCLLTGDAGARVLWDAFVFSSEQATFFHRSGWQRVIEEVFQHRTYFLYAEKDGVVEGVLPLAHVKSMLFGSSLVSLPFAVYGGIVAVNDHAVVLLEEAAQKIAHSLDVDHLEVRNFNQRHVDWPTQDLYVTFRKSIVPVEDDNLLAIPRKQRAMIRKGIKNGLTSLAESNINNFFNLYSSNVHRHGTPAMPKKYFLALLNEFKDDCKILTVFTKSGQPLSSVLSFYFRDEVLPYYAGDDPSARDLAANDFKYWELMRLACASGLKTFDYGRSKVGTGSFAFKKNWGFEPKSLSYEYCLFKRDSIPQNNPSNKKYKFVISVWKKLPISVANALGPIIVKNLG